MLLIAVVAPVASAMAQDGEIQPPQLRSTIVPVYPAALTASENPPIGLVELAITIDEAGRVVYATPITYSSVAFLAAATDAVTDASFTPARLADGTAIAVEIAIELQFVPPVREVIAATAQIQGIIYSRGNKARLGGALISVVDTELETTTGPDGRFLLSGIPATTVTLRVLAADHTVYTSRETLGEGDDLAVEYYLEPEYFDPLRIVVEGERARREVSRKTITLKELVNVPGVGQDAIKVVQILPGVSTPSDLSGSILVRGSSDRDNFIEIDDMPVPYIFHLLGVSSVLSSYLIEGIDFYPSNFGPRYADAIGGAFIVRTREPARDTWRGSVNVGTLLAEAYTEGPINDKVSVLVSARRSYFDAILKAALPDNTGFSFVTAPQFADYQAKISYRPAPGHRVSFFLNGAYDTLRLLLDKDQLVDPEQFQDFAITQSFHIFRARYRNTVLENVSNDLTVGLGTDGQDVSVDSDSLFFNLNNDLLRLRDELTWKPVSGTTVRGGAWIDQGRYRTDILLPEPPRRGDFDYDFLTAERKAAKGTQASSKYVLYADVEQEAGPLTIAAGANVSKISLAPYWLADPRGQVRVRAGASTIIKAAAGVYHQYPSPQFFIAEAGGNPDDSPPGSERSFHYLAGVEQELPWGLELLLEGYYKDMDHLIRQTDDPLDRVRYINDAVGRAYGVEVTLRKPFTKRIFGWLNYSYAKSQRKEPGDADWTAAEFDQPHIFNAVLSAMVTKAWRVGGRFRYASGNPQYSTDRAVFYTDSLSYVEVPSETRDRRQPSYQRLDIRSDYTWLFPRWSLTTYQEVLNVYAHDNPVGENAAFDYSEREIVNSFPVLINFGLKADF